ncbi:MAG TPA: hypothetical protein VHO25_17390 [Polyangiaceae bacterium]|nr:hypothetical protein [Polyangiaceae bacterium]
MTSDGSKPVQFAQCAPPAQPPVRQDHTVVRTQKTCRQVFLLYQGQAGRMMMDPLAFLRTAGLTDRNLVMMGDRTKRFYQHGLSADIPNIPSFMAWQKQLLERMPHASDVMCVGSSSGAYAAILSGYFLKAREVWAFAPPTDLKTVCEEFGGTEILDPNYADLRPFLENGNGVTKYHIFYNESATHDRVAALRLQSCDGVVLHSERGTGHGVVIHLAETGKLKTLMPAFAPA